MFEYFSLILLLKDIVLFFGTIYPCGKFTDWVKPELKQYNFPYVLNYYIKMYRVCVCDILVIMY